MTEAEVILFPLCGRDNPDLRERFDNVIRLDRITHDDLDRKLNALIREIEGGGDDAA